MELSNIKFPKVLNSEGKTAIDYLRETKKVFIIKSFPNENRRQRCYRLLIQVPLK